MSIPCPAQLPAKLNGKVALITGSGRGIGRAIALKLAAEGARVVINDIDAEVAEQVVQEIGPTQALACPGDVSAPNFGERFVGAALSAFGAIDIIVNNAGYTWDSLIDKMTDEHFDAMLDVHLKAPFRILRAASIPLRAAAKSDAASGNRARRKVVNISSIAGTCGNAGQANYASAKAGVIGLTRAMAKEWGRYNVNVNCVVFGLIETRMTRALDSACTIRIGGRELRVGIKQALVDRITEMAPLGRAGTIEEAAGAVYLLCIPESDYISGQVLVASGGFAF